MIRQFDFINGPETDTLPDHGVIDPVYSVTKSTSYAMTDTDGYSVIYCTAAITITLPQAANNQDRRILIINNSTGSIIVDGYGSELINGSTTYTLTNQYDSIWLESNATKWISISLATSSLTSSLIQDFTTISSVGTASQQYAGHIPLHANGGYNDLNTTWAEVLAYYKFANGALTTDEKAAYTLTNNGTATNANGIMGTAFGTELNGSSQYYTQSTLLDTAPTSLAIDLWFSCDDGQPATANTILSKYNDANNYIDLTIGTNGILTLSLDAASTLKTIKSVLILPNGATSWYYVCVSWDSTYGLRLWINGVLEGQIASSYMSNGTTNDFCIGAKSSGGISQYYDGKLCNFRFRDKVLSQTDIDIAYATVYSNGMGTTNQDFKALIQKGGDTDLIQNYNFPNIVVGLDSTYIYRAGGLITGLSSTDKLKIYGRI